jgi:hypothetical protein
LVSLFTGKDRMVASLTIEHGIIKLLVCRGLEVLDYRVLLANPRYFREGQVSNPARVASLIDSTLPEMQGSFRRVIGGVPGFQNRLRLMHFPRARGFDPKLVIPQEASRLMRVSTETYNLSWFQLPDRQDRTRWLVLATSRRSIASLVETAERANIQVSLLDLRPFALARVVNQPDAVIAWAAPDGCDVVVVKDSVPLDHQSLFWGAELVEETVLVDRLTEVVGRTVSTFNETPPEGPLSDEAPLFVRGSPLRREPAIVHRVADNLGRPVGELDIPLAGPPDFPLQDLIVNAGLILREN